jgi:NAD(P)-dependent dehydrogenase (short-subunit alcohol dehydrogenase family)
MSERLAGEVAVVTGGGAGIGEAACVRFAEEGAHVVAVDWDGDAARETVETVEAAGGPQGLAVETDVSDEAAVETMAEAVAEEFGRVDVLVNNAGIRVDPKPVTEADEDSWDDILGVNLKGYAFCAKHLLPLMTGEGAGSSATADDGDDGGRDGGSIVNVASIGATWARPGWSQYDSTKGAIVSLTQDMACDHAEQGIRVNAVSPGWVITDYHVGDRTGADAERFVDEKTTPGGHDGNILERAARPEELADALLFLASEESSFLTGVNVPVDGGSSVL